MTAVLDKKNTQHVAQGLALLGEAFKGKPNMTALLTCYLNRIQDLENTIWAVIEGYLLPNAVGVQLDTLGDLVGEPRQGRIDSDYRIAIQVTIRVYKTQGRDLDVIAVAALMGFVFTYTELYPAGFEVDQFGVSLTFVQWAKQKFLETKAAGTGLALVYTPELQSNSFIWSSAHGGSTPGKGWSDSYTPSDHQGYLGGVA